MSPKAALRQALRIKFGSLENAAAAAGMGASTLRNVLNDNIETHHLQFDDYVELVTLSDSDAPKQALCREFGGVFVPIERTDDLCDAALLESVTELCKDFGDVMSSVNQSLSDGRIDRREVEQYEAQLHQFHVAAAKLGARLRQLADAERK